MLGCWVVGSGDGFGCWGIGVSLCRGRVLGWLIGCYGCWGVGWLRGWEYKNKTKNQKKKKKHIQKSKKDSKLIQMFGEVIQKIDNF